MPRRAGRERLEFHQLDRMKAAGKRAAVEALESAPAEQLARFTG